jgi:hypothetical protein
VILERREAGDRLPLNTERRDALRLVDALEVVVYVLRGQWWRLV